ncbi:hypothetical protein AB0H76_15320 [Nocardia sp. NPDC050712]|uniref:hypothetical protein n=1 Tax=Nocardia sp. NPDC050712 TaxID=3155518 RepID=UPI0033DD2D02
MSRKLATYVHVPDADGEYHVFGPDDDVPAWAVKAITNPGVWAVKAITNPGVWAVKAITNPGVWAGGDPEPSEERPSDSWTVADLKAYADLRDFDLGEATKKADILAAIRASEGDGSPAV